MAMKQKVIQGTALLHKRERARVFIIAFSVVAFSLYAGEIRWTGGGQTTSMAEGANWGGTAPGASDTAVVYGNTAATPAIAPGGNTTYTGLWVSNYGDGFVLQTNGTVTVTGKRFSRTLPMSKSRRAGLRLRRWDSISALRTACSTSRLAARFP